MNFTKLRLTLLAFLLVLLIVIPFYFVIIGGFMSSEEIFHRPPYLLPPNPTLKYYTQALRELAPYIKNSMLISFGVLLITLFIALPASFVMAKFNFLFKNFLYILYTFVQMLPVSSLVIPLFLIFNNLHLINNYLSAILGIGTITIPFSVIILTTYIREIPNEIIESAMIDGASLFRIFYSIILPLSKSSIASVTILIFIMAWSDFLVSLSFLKDKSLQPTSVGLYNYIGQFGVQWNKLMAGSTIYSLPVVILVIIAGRLIISGLVSGSLKE